MPAGRYDFDRITQGDTLVETFAFTTDGTTPYDLTGATIRTQFRTAPADQGGIVAIDASAYWTIDPDPTSGRATLEVPAAATGGVSTAGACDGEVLDLLYDIEIEDAAGRVFTWLTGRLPVRPQVTA
jgi:hypothetical protein